MLKFVTANAIAIVVAAALVGSLAVVLTSLVPEAKAEVMVATPLAQSPTIAKGATCSWQGWPYYDQGCQFDRRGPASETRTVRVIALR